jgi:hypothetical protein
MQHRSLPFHLRLTPRRPKRSWRRGACPLSSTSSATTPTTPLRPTPSRPLPSEECDLCVLAGHIHKSHSSDAPASPPFRCPARAAFPIPALAPPEPRAPAWERRACSCPTRLRDACSRRSAAPRCRRRGASCSPTSRQASTSLASPARFSRCPRLPAPRPPPRSCEDTRRGSGWGVGQADGLTPVVLLLNEDAHPPRVHAAGVLQARGPPDSSPPPLLLPSSFSSSSSSSSPHLLISSSSSSSSSPLLPFSSYLETLRFSIFALLIPHPRALPAPSPPPDAPPSAANAPGACGAAAGAVPRRGVLSGAGPDGCSQAHGAAAPPIPESGWLTPAPRGACGPFLPCRSATRNATGPRPADEPRAGG